MLLVIKTLDIKRYVCIKTCLYHFSRDFSSSLAIEMYRRPFFLYLESTTVFSDIQQIIIIYTIYTMTVFSDNTVLRVYVTHSFLNCCLVRKLLCWCPFQSMAQCKKLKFCLTKRKGLPFRYVASHSLRNR